MSLRPGSWAQPDFEISSGMERAAAQRGQLVWPRAISPPHQEHFPPVDWTFSSGSGGGAVYEDWTAGSGPGGAPYAAGGPSFQGGAQASPEFLTARILVPQIPEEHRPLFFAPLCTYIDWMPMRP